jgi:hypothetical protein
MTATTEEVRAPNDVMPFSAPAFPKTWECVDAHGVHISFATDEGAVKELLAVTPFDFVAARVWAYAGRLVGHGLAPAQEAWHYYGLYVPVRFRGEVGRYPVYMYADNVEAITAGRELLGEPKKWADFRWTETNGGLQMEASRYGRVLVSIDAAIETQTSDESPFADLLAGTAYDGGAAPSDFTFRSIPSPAPTGQAVQDVIVNPAEGKTTSVNATIRRFEMYSGQDEPWLTRDPLGDLRIARIVRAYWQTSSFRNGVKSDRPASVHRIAG